MNERLKLADSVRTVHGEMKIYEHSEKPGKFVACYMEVIIYDIDYYQIMGYTVYLWRDGDTIAQITPRDNEEWRENGEKGEILAEGNVEWSKENSEFGLINEKGVNLDIDEILYQAEDKKLTIKISGVRRR